MASGVIRGELLDEWSGGMPTPLAACIARRAQAGLPVWDLAGARPEEHGLLCSPSIVEEAFSHAVRESAVYHADPLGLPESRAAVAEWHGAMDASRILITPGTSFAYWMIFRLLASPGAEVLCPSPTYPLFADLTRAAGIGVRRYYLGHNDSGYHIDEQELDFQVTERTVAIVVVSPHNPTGAVASRSELDAVARMAARHNLAVIHDEVFRDSCHGGIAPQRFTESQAPLVITLNGLSKMLCLPGLKFGWMVIEGAPSEVRRFMEAAEYLADAFLPCSDFVQRAGAWLLQNAGAESRRLQAILSERVRQMTCAWNNAGIPVAKPQAGPYLILPTPGPSLDTEPLAVAVASQEGVVLHPGNHYELPEPSLVCTAIHAPPWPIEAAAAVIRSGGAHAPDSVRP